MGFNDIRQKYYEDTGYSTETCDKCGFRHGDHDCIPMTDLYYE